MMKYYKDMENIHVGDRMKLSILNILTATCQEVHDGMAVFCMDQYLGRIMPVLEGSYETSELRKEINSKSILSLFPVDIQSNLVPFENGDLVRIPYAEELFGQKDITRFDICHNKYINRWPLMKDRRNRICFINENIPSWGWLMDKVDENHFAIVNKLGDMSKCITNEAGGIRLVFQVKIPVIKREDEVKADYIIQGKNDNPILTISCSMKQELSAKKLIRNLHLQFPNATIYDPFMEPYRLLSIQEKRRKYIDYIRSSSALIAISKSNCTIEIGESVSWEVAIAEHFSIPILFFLDGQILE